MLSVKNLDIQFEIENQPQSIVTQLCFEIPEGKTIGLVGESGSGKSLTALALMQLTPPEAILKGHIFWENQDILTYSDHQLHGLRGRQMGMIFQNPLASLNPVFTIGFQMIETIQIHHKMDKAGAQKMAIDLLNQVRIANPEKRLSDYPHQLSLGMCQRVVIALALAMQPRLLIADEPTASLDVTVQAQILALLHDIKTQRNMSMLLISHDMAVIAQNCDWVMVMYRGQLVEQGTPEALFKTPKHPYTQQLIAAIPTFGKDRPSFEALPDESQTPTFTAACRFYARCTRRRPECIQSFPAWKKFSPQHQVACWAADV